MTVRCRGLAGMLVAVAATAAAQTIPFQILVTEGQNAITVANGATLTFQSTIGQSQSAQITVTYLGTGQAAFANEPTLYGSSQFKVSVTNTLPTVLTPDSNLSMSVQFTPTSAAATNAQINLPYTETLSTGTMNEGTITISLQGTASSFVLSYAFATNQNIVPLQPGGTIPFAPTLSGTTAQATLNLTNAGSGPGSVTGISITGSAFQLEGIPLLPATIQSSATLTVLVLYTPSGIGSADTGQINITYGTGSPATINLTGSGDSPVYSLQLLNTSPPIAVSAGGTISVPNTQVGQSSSLSVQLQNTGSATGTVNTISIAGQGYALNSVPVLPQTLAVGASLTFTITFTPTQPGAANGTLIVNSETFQLNGSGLGSLLTFSYVTGGTTITLNTANDSVIFSPLAISQSEQISFDVTNSGTLPATLSNIGVGQTEGPFTISGLPPLPVTLAPNGSFQITITFTPVSLGFSNGTLVLDSTTITLVGSGTAPPALPAYTISGPNGTVAPMTQPSIGLTLSSAYPVAISGVLTLEVSGNLPGDPAVQFATGGRTVSFVIPANQTSAVFASSGTQIGIQTGTVAGTIALVPSFATQAGSVNLTPTSPASLQFSVAPAVPGLIAVEIADLSTTGFTIEVTGFTTTRILNSMTVQFTTNSGFVMPTSKFTVNLQQIATVWFESTGSQDFGGEFTISVPFTFQGSLPTGQSVVSSIASVSATITNDQGTSAALTTAIP